LRGSLQDVMADTLSGISVKRRGLLDANEVAVVRDDFFSERADWSRVWLLMMIELWAREVLDCSATGGIVETQPRELSRAHATRRGEA